MARQDFASHAASHTLLLRRLDPKAPSADLSHQLRCRRETDDDSIARYAAMLDPRRALCLSCRRTALDPQGAAFAEHSHACFAAAWPTFDDETDDGSKTALHSLAQRRAERRCLVRTDTGARVPPVLTAGVAWGSLPADVLVDIFCWLDPPALAAATSACRQWHDAVTGDWHRLCAASWSPLAAHSDGQVC